METFSSCSPSSSHSSSPFDKLLVLPLEMQKTSSSSLQAYVRPGARNTVFTTDGAKDEVQQVHISMVRGNKMQVSWITLSSKAPSTVEYGTVPGKYVASANGHSLKYNYLSYTSALIHHTVVGPLEPATTYYYRCSKVGREFSFRTPPSCLPIEFAIVGDLGQTDWTRSTLQHVSETEYDVFLLPGDLSYADRDQTRWDSFGRLVQPYASSRPWMTAEGNHEVETIPKTNQPEPFKAYNARWLMPFKESSSTCNLYYSFDVAGGSVHVIMLGSDMPCGADSDQYRWLEGDLARVDRTRTPWVFVLLHMPWYNSNSAHQGEGEPMRQAMEKLLYNKVDVVFSGHVHAYERFTRVYDNSADPRGPVYITIGDGGNREGLATEFKNPAPPISMFREASFGHGRLRVINGTKAYWAWHRNNDSESVVADEVWLESLSLSSARDEL